MKRLLIAPGWLAALCLIVSLMQPSGLLAQDDDEEGVDEGDDVVVPFQSDDGDGDDGEEEGDDDDEPALPPAGEEDNGDDGDGTDDDGGDGDEDSGGDEGDDGGGDDDGGDDDGDDDGGAPPPPVTDNDDNDDGDDGGAPPPPATDNDDSDDGDDDLNDSILELDDDDNDDATDRPISNQALVQLDQGADAGEFASRYGTAVLRVIPVPNIALLRLDSAVGDGRELNALLADADVIWSERNFTTQAPEGRPRYFFSSVAGEPQIVDGPALPEGLEFSPGDACVTGESAVIAVLDTGVDPDHPALAANILANGVNMIENTFDVRDLPNGIDDDQDGQVDEMVGHGTHVAGIALQVAPDADILPVKVLNSDGVGDAFSVTAGIYYAVEQGADVINLSLGTTYESIAIQTAVDDASSDGVIVVAATGNGDRSLPVEFPAAADSVISVASTTAGADKASYSNFNEFVDISAPGSNVSSAYPDGLYTSASGTSMSAPIVAGSIALILERQPDVTVESIFAVLQSTSGPFELSDPALEGMLGAGEIDIDAMISCSG
ncbi:MAG: S8 family serine peptidase [Chloroflexia bacterium]|nr:S8 family serine peptidase [Chloroflexia bacterium]